MSLIYAEVSRLRAVSAGCRHAPLFWPEVATVLAEHDPAVAIAPSPGRMPT
jgi:hypothetical protein